MKTLKVVTHNGIFHADEVTAVALLKAFSNEEIEVVRVPHNTEESKLLEARGEDGYIVDIGLKYNPDERRFDHHQADYKGELASAGMVAGYLSDRMITRTYNMLKEIIQVVDLNDNGIVKSGPAELPALVAGYNPTGNDIYDKEISDKAFHKAVSMVYDIIINIHRRAVQIEKAVNDLNKASITDNILVSETYIDGWTDVIWETDIPAKADIYMWYDDKNNQWKAQNIPSKDDAFKPVGRSLKYVEPSPEGMVFIHKGNFFVVGESKEALLNYIKNYC